MIRDMGVHMKGGVITERDAEYCTIRTRIPAGIVSVEQLRGIADIAEKYGVENIHLTTRQTIEIPHMDPARLDSISGDLAGNNTPIGSERDEVVNVVSCPGKERCVFANIDTVSLAKTLDGKVFGKEMPVKMRISISGPECLYKSDAQRNRHYRAYRTAPYRRHMHRLRHVRGILQGIRNHHQEGQLGS